MLWPSKTWRLNVFKVILAEKKTCEGIPPEEHPKIIHTDNSLELNEECEE